MGLELTESATSEHVNSDIKPPKRRRKNERTPEYLTPSELESFFAVIDDKRDEAMFRVMYTKGLRASEVGRLTMADFNDRERSLFVRRLKGSRSAPFPMHDRELRALRAWLKVRGSAPGALFPSRNHRPISRIRIFELMRKYCAAAGIAKVKAHPHAMKHSRGTHLLDETGKVHVVQDALGHKNIANTMKYAQIGNRERAEAVSINQSKY